MKKIAMTLFAVTAAIFAGSACAETIVRARAIEIMPDASSSPVKGVDVENKLAPDLDASWFFSKNFAVELLLTVPQTHKVTLNGADIGKAQHLPPTVLVQYYLPTGERFRPYVGAGLNYTLFTDRKLDGGMRLESSSIGPALQAGLDFALRDGWYLNVDLKKIWIDSDVSNASGFVTHVNIDPLVIGAGVGFAFR